MRKLKLEVQMSIDGYIADANGKTDWMVWNWTDDWSWDDELRRYHIDLTTSSDCILLGRKMAEEGFVNHWEKVAENPADPQYAFAKPITEMPKLVFTKTFEKTNPVVTGWKNTELIKGDLVKEINQLKTRRGKDIIAYGGPTFASSLIRAGLIDEFHLFVNPTVLGSGIPYFKELAGKLNLCLVKSESYDCGVSVIQYVKQKEIGP